MHKELKKSKRVCIALITDEHDNILMGQRNDNGLWTNIAGHAEKKEDPHNAMIRELKEEAGLDAKDLRLIGAHWDKEQNILLYLFKIDIDPSQPLDWSKDPDQEFKEIKFVNPIDIIENLHVNIERNIALQYWMNN